MNNLLYCSKCKVFKTIDNFHIDNNRPYRQCRGLYCKDCRLSKKFTKEVELFQKGFKKCSNCKVIKNLSDFTLRRGNTIKVKVRSKYSCTCKECDKKNNTVYQKKAVTDLKNCYLRKSLKALDIEITDESLKIIKLQKLIRRTNGVYYNNTFFPSVRKFAHWASLNNLTNVKEHTIRWRISKGLTAVQALKNI